MRLRNFLLTRFGVGQSLPSFYDARMDLFEGVFIPSLLRQTAQNFELLLLTDTRAPKEVLARMKEILLSFPSGKLVLHDPFDSLNIMPDVPSLLAAEGVKEGEFVTTTRLDADDALHQDFFRVLSQAAAGHLQSDNGKLPCAFESNQGVFYYPAAKLGLRVAKDNYSVISIGDLWGQNFLHCHSFAHTQINREFRQSPARNTVQLGFDGDPIWLRSIHEHTYTRVGRPVSVFESRLYALRIFRSVLRRAFGRGGGQNNFLAKASPAEIAGMFGIDVHALGELSRGRQREPGISSAVFIERYMDAPQKPYNAKSKILDYYADLENKSDEVLASVKHDFYSF